MNRRVGVCVVICLSVLFTACKKSASDQDDVRTAIEKRLSQRGDLNLGVMDREVKQVSINGDHANADVEFRLKGGDAKMEIEYTLERQNNEWQVTNSQPMGMGNTPQSPGQMPEGGPNSGGQQMPQGHPPVN